MKRNRRQASQRQRRLVAAIRARGKAAYVWRRGVLGYGLPWAFMMAAFTYFMFPPEFYAPLIPWALPRFIGWLALLLPFGLAAGYLWGRLTWWQFERNGWYLPQASDEPPAGST